MADLHFSNVGIAALTCAVPSFVQKVNVDPASPNAAYIKSFVKQTGITQRHISLTEQTCTDFGYAAVLKALDKAGWAAQSLDALVFMSQTPDYNPATGNAFVLHKRLELSTDALAFDVTLGCSSLPYGLSICASLLQQDAVRRIAMISGDTVWQSCRSREELLAQEYFITGEGCTALLLERRPGSPLDISLHSDGSGYHFLFDAYGGARNAWRWQPKVLLPNGVEYTGGGYMDGLEITAFSTGTVVRHIKEFLARREKTLDDYDALVLHQANLQIITTMAKRLKIGMEKVPVSLDRYANTAGASPTITLADAYGGKNLGPLSLLTCAFGIGLSWGMAAFTLDMSVIEPIFTYDGRFEEGFVRPLPS